jgi:hypothetical protein
MGADGATVAHATDTAATAPRDDTLIRAGAAQRLARSSALVPGLHRLGGAPRRRPATDPA